MALAQRMRNSYNSPGVGGDLPAKPGRSRGIEGGRRSMRGRVSRRSVGLVAGLSLVLGACAHNAPSTDAAAADSELNRPPTDYKREILGAMHAYLNDPTGIRDAGIAEPALKTIGNTTRYVVCVRFNAKKRGGGYTGAKDIAAVFMVGRFDHFVDKAQEPCAGATYAPFPELQKLSR